MRELKRVRVLLICFSMLMSGCGPTIRPATNIEKKYSNVLAICIDDTIAKRNADGVEFIKKLKSILSKRFSSVIVSTGCTNGNDAELKLGIMSVRSQQEFFFGDSRASTFVSFEMLNRPFEIRSEYNHVGSGSEVFMIGAITLVTLTIGYFVIRNTAESSLRDGSFEDAAIGVYNNIVSTSDFEMLAQSALLQKTSPSDLTLSAKFTDASSFHPNSTLDAGEGAEMVVYVKNSGKGIGIGPVLNISSDNSRIDFNREISIGDIPPGESKEIRVPLKAGLDIADGKTEFLLNVTEKRKYDSNKVKMTLQTAKLERPKLEIVSTEIEDGNVGLAKGNGNHIIESGETVELTAFVRNSGVGSALGVNLVGSDMTSGVIWLDGHDKAFIGTVAPGETAKTKLAFSVPPNFDAKSIAANLRVFDVRLIDKAEFKFAQGYSIKLPELQYGYQIFAKGVRTESITNSGEYEVEFTVQNSGEMTAKNVTVSVSPDPGVNVSRSRMNIGDVKEKANAQPQRFTISVPRTYKAAKAPFSIEIAQSYFPPSSSSVQIPVDVKSPDLTYTANLVSKNRGNSLEQREQAMLEVMVVNNGSLAAEGVKIALASGNEDLEIMDKNEALVGTIPSGRAADPVKFKVFARPRLEVGETKLGVHITQNEFPAINQQYALNILEEGFTVIDVAGEGRARQTASASTQAGPKISLKGVASETSSPTVVEDETYRLAFEVADASNISKVMVLVNGMAITGITETVNEAVRTARNKSRIPILLPDIPLAPGSNTIQITAYNAANGKSAPIEFKVTRAIERDVDDAPITGQNKKNAVAVVIGISKQEDKGIDGVAYAAHDAKIMHDYLLSQLGYGKADIFLFTDRNATKPKIDTLISTDLKNRVEEKRMAQKRGGPEPEVFIYFSGHGYPIDDERYLLTYDTVKKNIANTSYSVGKLFDEVAKLNVKSTIVLDACYSGKSGSGENIIKGVSAAVKRTKNPADRVKNGIVFTAAGPEQYANWYDEKQHGLFTYYFLQGIGGAADRNSDGKITVGELKNYVSAKVLVQSQKKGEDYRQTPEVKGDDEEIVVEAYQ
jgi:hypothetical protein